MDLYDIGFSNIRLPNDKNSYIYTYNTSINIFPEEVLIHEFLHSLERIMNEYGYDIPELHDYTKYGYSEEKLIGLRNWYKDYMQKAIYNEQTGEYIGLYEDVYILTPAHESDFEFSMEVGFNNEPSNILGDINSIFRVIFKGLNI